MIKILADECIHSDLISSLRKANLDVVTATEAGLSAKSDETVFAKAVSSKRILLTFDRGFGDIFRFDISASPGIVILLIGRMDKTEIINIPLAFFTKLGKRQLAGQLVIIGKHRIRISQR